MGGTIYGGDAGSKPTSIGIGNNRSPVIGKVPLVQGSDVQKAYNSWLTPQSLGYTADTMSAPDWYAAYNSATNNGTAKPTMSTLPVNKTTTRSSGSSGGGGGGGGGGGAAAAPQLSQGMLDWYAGLLKGAKPGQLTQNNLDLPDWQDVNITPFNNQRYAALRDSLGQAVASDRSAASGAYDQLTNYLQSNYSNPYANATYATSQNVPGQTQLAMQRMLQSQGQNPNMANDTYRQGQSADQAFGNVLGLLGSNEDVAQRNRLSAVQADRGTTQRALDMAQLQGMTGIGQQEGAAQEAWQQRSDDRGLLNAQQRAQLAQQEAMANWQRGNEVGDANVNSQTSYRNSILSQLTGLLPQLVAQGGTLTLPDLAALGLA